MGMYWMFKEEGEMKEMSKISSETDFDTWNSLWTSAQGDMIAAIKKLRRLEGFDFEQILGVFSIHLYKEYKEK